MECDTDDSSSCSLVEAESETGDGDESDDEGRVHGVEGANWYRVEELLRVRGKGNNLSALVRWRPQRCGASVPDSWIQVRRLSRDLQRAASRMSRLGRKPSNPMKRRPTAQHRLFLTSGRKRVRGRSRLWQSASARRALPPGRVELQWCDARGSTGARNLDWFGGAAAALPRGAKRSRVIVDSDDDFADGAAGGSGDRGAGHAPSDCSGDRAHGQGARVTRATRARIGRHTHIAI